MKRYNTVLSNTIITACLAISLGGCASTTNMGTMGSQRPQLMLVPSATIQKNAYKRYKNILYQAKRAHRLDTNKAQLQRLKRISKSLIVHTPIYRSDARYWRWEIHTIKSDDQINAFVLSGGKIIVYTGIIDKLKLTDGEIATIIGHEIAHALREHHRERVSSKYAMKAGVTLLSSKLALSQSQSLLAGYTGQIGIRLPHGRVQEQEADIIGLELMARAGYHPKSALSLWKKLKKVKPARTPQFLSTHPHPSQRILNIQNLIPAVLPLYQQKINGNRRRSQGKNK